MARCSAGGGDRGEKDMVSRLETDRLATVFGGSGFVGRHVVRALARRGYRVRAAVRRPDLAGYLQPMGVVGQVLPVQANLRFPASIPPVIEGADTVINAVGILAPTGRQTFDAVHVKGAREVARAAKAAGASTFVHISAIGADRNGAANYARSKGEAEAAVLAEFPEAVILRPSIIFGPEDEFFNRFAAMAAMSPLLPLIGGGRTRFQPVFVGDVAEAVARAADGQAIPGTVYELGGPEVQSFRRLLDKTKTWAGRNNRYLPMPFWTAKLIALLTWPLPNALRPMTLDQVRMLQADNIVSAAAEQEGRTLAGLGITAPHSADAIVPDYLERFRPRGQYSHYRG
jgi:uncharacterized protein YbjT (DUF2867 family)